MFSGSAIFEENVRGGASNWQVIAPTAAQRPVGPNGIIWNGFTDSTQLTYADRIQGFTSRMSYDLGEQELAVEFKVDCPNVPFDVEIYRLGDYGGDGCVMDKLKNNLAFAQPLAPAADSTTGLRECSTWVTNVVWRPEKINGQYQYRNPDEDPDGTGSQLAPAYPLLSGVYYVKLKRNDPGGGPEKGSGVVFVLTDNAASSAIVMQVADTTWQAYNFWGNKSLYYNKMDVGIHPTLNYREGTRAFKISYNRPFDMRSM